MRSLVRCVAIVFCFMPISGCVSFKFTTTIHKIPDAESLVPEKTTFKIITTPRTCDGTTLALAGTTEGYVPRMYAEKQKREGNLFDPKAFPQFVAASLPGMLMETATNRYPGIFAETQNSIPLIVSIDRKYKSSDLDAAALICVLSALILPMYASETSTFNIGVSLLGAGANSLHIASIPFERRDGMLFSLFSPLGLIPIPGHADKRTTSVLIPPSVDFGGELTLNSIVDATVLGLTRQGRTGFAKRMDPQKTQR
jgi:hypothetical protein